MRIKTIIFLTLLLSYQTVQAAGTETTSYSKTQLTTTIYLAAKSPKPSKATSYSKTIINQSAGTVLQTALLVISAEQLKNRGFVSSWMFTRNNKNQWIATMLDTEGKSFNLPGNYEIKGSLITRMSSSWKTSSGYTITTNINRSENGAGSTETKITNSKGKLMATISGPIQSIEATEFNQKLGTLSLSNVKKYMLPIGLPPKAPN